MLHTKFQIRWSDDNRPDEDILAFLEDNNISENAVFTISSISEEDQLVWAKEIPDYALPFDDVYFLD